MTVHINGSKGKELYYNGAKIKEAYYGSTKVYSSRPLYYCYIRGSSYYYFNEYPYVGAVLPLYVCTSSIFGKASDSSQVASAGSFNATFKSVTDNGAVFNMGGNDINATRDLTGDLYT